MKVNDSLQKLLENAGTGALQTFGNVLAGNKSSGADTVAVAEKSKWDWRMIGVIGAVVVGLVLLFKFRK